MSRPLAARLRRLAHPRSRRSHLWACVYRGTFGGASDANDGEPD